MTTTINLLPWREERRKQQQQEFIMLLVLFFQGAGRYLSLDYWIARRLLQSETV